jgi:hypothetical protein
LIPSLTAYFLGGGSQSESVGRRMCSLGRYIRNNHHVSCLLHQQSVPRGLSLLRPPPFKSSSLLDRTLGCLLYFLRPTWRVHFPSQPNFLVPVADSPATGFSVKHSTTRGSSRWGDLYGLGDCPPLSRTWGRVWVCVNHAPSAKHVRPRRPADKSLPRAINQYHGP